MINTVLKFPHTKFRFNWMNISLFVPEFLPWSVSRNVRGSQRCFVNKAVLAVGAVLLAGLSVTYHTEILQNMIMQKGAELQPFNVHTLVTHLVNVFLLLKCMTRYFFECHSHNYARSLRKFALIELHVLQ